MKSLKDFVGKTPRHRVVVEYGGKDWELWVREPSAQEYGDKVIGKPNPDVVALLVYESEDSEAPFFTAEEFRDLPNPLASAIASEMIDVLTGIGKKKD